MHRIKGHKTHRPLVPFGEAVLFKIPNTRHRVGDFEDRFEKGIWLGMTVQSGENVVGTANGVYRVAGIIRCAPDRRWLSEMLDKISGTPSEPRPGSGSDKIPTYAKRRDDQPVTQDKFAAPPIAEAPNVRPAYIYANDVREHGASDGCKACEAALRKGNSTGYTHPASCRLRFEELFRSAGSDRLRRADERMNEAVFQASAVPEAAPAAEEEETMQDDSATDAATAGAQDDQAAQATVPAAPASLPTNAQLRARLAAHRAGGAARAGGELWRPQGRKRQADGEAEDASQPDGLRPTQHFNIGSPAVSPQTGAATATAASSNPSASGATPQTGAATAASSNPSASGATTAEGSMDEHMAALEVSIDAAAIKDETVGGREVMTHPGPIMPTRQIPKSDCEG